MNASTTDPTDFNVVVPFDVGQAVHLIVEFVEGFLALGAATELKSPTEVLEEMD